MEEKSTKVIRERKKNNNHREVEENTKANNDSVLGNVGLPSVFKISSSESAVVVQESLKNRDFFAKKCDFLLLISGALQANINLRANKLLKMKEIHRFLPRARRGDSCARCSRDSHRFQRTCPSRSQCTHEGRLGRISAL